MKPRAAIRRAGAVLAAGLLAAALTACSGDEDTPAPAGGPTTSTPPVAPLTGLALDDAQRASRPALSVKVDNAPAARPQTGLEKADVVYEEMVEGGFVRFLAVFHSQDVASVGPVRSVRPVDPDIVTPLRGLFSYAGGTGPFKASIQRAPVKLVGIDELESAYSKRRGRSAPSNLYADTAKLYQAAEKEMPPPPPLFGFLAAGQPFAPAGTGPATHLSVQVSGASRAEWDYDVAANGWLRRSNGTPHTVEGGAQLRFSNVVVQFVAYRNTTTRDAAGNLAPDATVVGNGQALVVSGGKVARATWSKASATAVTTYADESGQPILFTPGTTWITLAPIGAPAQTR